MRRSSINTVNCFIQTSDDIGSEKWRSSPFKIYLHAPTQGCLATAQRIEIVGLFLASFAGTKGISGTAGTMNEKGKSLEKQKIAVSWRSDKKECPLGSAVEHSLHTRGVSSSNLLAGTNSLRKRATLSRPFLYANYLFSLN